MNSKILKLNLRSHGFFHKVFWKKIKNKLILNLKKFNQHVVYRHFKMGNLNTAVTIDKKNCYMASAVISNAYFSPPVSLVLLSLVLISLHQCQKYCFLLRTNFKILYLPNGLPSAKEYSRNSWNMYFLIIEN